MQAPLDDAFASPRIPDANRVWVSAGVSQQLGASATLHLGVRRFGRGVGIRYVDAKRRFVYAAAIHANAYDAAQRNWHIGLALSRDLARAMGGDLSVTDDGAETVFVLRLADLSLTPEEEPK